MNVKHIYCNASCWVLQIDSLSRIYNGFGVEQKIEPESVMISFRAPGDVATLLNNAEIVTGLNRTELLLTCIRLHLPGLALQLSGSHEARLMDAQRAFRAVATNDLGQSGSSAPVSYKTAPPRSERKPKFGKG